MTIPNMALFFGCLWIGWVCVRVHFCTFVSYYAISALSISGRVPHQCSGSFIHVLSCCCWYLVFFCGVLQFFNFRSCFKCSNISFANASVGTIAKPFTHDVSAYYTLQRNMECVCYVEHTFVQGQIGSRPKWNESEKWTNEYKTKQIKIKHTRISSLIHPLYGVVADRTNEDVFWNAPFSQQSKKKTTE